MVWEVIKALESLGFKVYTMSCNAIFFVYTTVTVVHSMHNALTWVDPIWNPAHYTNKIPAVLTHCMYAPSHIAHVCIIYLSRHIFIHIICVYVGDVIDMWWGCLKLGVLQTSCKWGQPETWSHLSYQEHICSRWPICVLFFGCTTFNKN
jgi:hypothetical protein